MILHTKLFKKLSVNSFELTIPTLFTLFRFVLVPFVVFSMIRNQWGVAFWLFVIAVLSDIFTTTTKILVPFRLINNIFHLSVLSGIVSKDCPSGYWIEAHR